MFKMLYRSVPARTFCVAIIATGVASFAVAQTVNPNALSVRSKMAVNGIGSVRVGIPLTKAIDSSAMPWRVENSWAEGGDCRYARPVMEDKSDAPGLSFMVVGGVVVRAEVDKPGIATVSGVQVGDSEAKVKAAYAGKIKTEVHPYDPAGHYLIYTPTDAKDAKSRLIFETDGKKVTSFRAGRLPEVRWIEGCS